jgi:capsular polysaccharide biosynthesis protein
MPAAGGAGAMTPKEILGILRRHVLMILILTVSGTIIGGVSWFLLDRFNPKYTAKTGIRVSQPGLKDPTKITNPQVQKDLYYQHRLTMASSIKMQSMLEKLIRERNIRELDWFKQFAKVDANGKIIGDKEKAVLKAFEDLEDNLGASAPRDQNFILVSMRTGSAKESAAIVDQMVRLFLEEQRQLALGDITGRLATLKQQRDDVQTRLKQVEGTLDAIRSGTRFARLNLGENQSFRDYMDTNISSLEVTQNTLESTKSRLESNIETLRVRAESALERNIDDRLQEQVEFDETARQMRAQIAVLEPRLGCCIGTQTWATACSVWR